nr:apolipoprotein N-acyltransferase [Polyangiaceae bacterium]
ALSGILYWIAFPSSPKFDHYGPVAFVALIPLLFALEGTRAKDAAKLGLLTGMGLNLGGFYWLYGMLKTFSGFPGPLCFVFMLILCAYQSLPMALFGWASRKVVERGGPQWFAILGAFALSETVVPLLFPWYFGASLHHTPVFLQVADLGGPVLVSVMLAGVNLALFELIRSRRTSTPLVRRNVAIGAALFAFTLVYGLYRTSKVVATIAASPVQKVGIVQGNLALMQKREDPYEGLKRHTRATEKLKEAGANLVVWSESSVAFWTPEEEYKTSYSRRFAKRVGVPLIFGGVVYRIDPDRERWFNTALSTDNEGNVLGRYDKQFLLAFGEYIPLGDTFPIVYKWSPHSGKFSPGTKLDALPITTPLGPKSAATLICYEDILPGFTNALVRNSSPDVLVNVTNDAWFGDTSEPWEHLALAKFRSIEHHRYLVRATNSGVSAIVDPLGNLVGHTETFVETTLLGEIRYLQGKTVFEYVGMMPWYATSVLVLFWATLGGKFKRKESATQA